MSQVSGKAYFVYVLWSKTGGSFYVGISEDPQRRLLQHNLGISRWTARHRPWELVLEERYADYQQARKREIALKRQKGGQGFFKLTGLRADQFRTSGS